MRALEAYRFWAWFSENHSRYLQLRQLDEKTIVSLCIELNMQLEKYCAGLLAEFPLNEDGENDLVITARGYEQYFDRAEDLVMMAPKLKDWRFIALRPPAEEYPVKLEYKGLQLSSDNLWMLPYEEPGEPHKLAVIVLFKDYEPAREDVYFRAANKMLFLILGEKSGIVDVPYLQVDKLEEDPLEFGILELEDLPSYIEMRKERAVLN